MSENKITISCLPMGCTGFLGVLTLIFITLRLCDVIDWHWGLVLMPIWALPALFLAIVAVVIGLVLLVVIVAAIPAGIYGLYCLFGGQKRFTLAGKRKMEQKRAKKILEQEDCL